MQTYRLIDAHTNKRQMDSQTDGQTDRYTDTETYCGWTNRQTSDRQIADRWTDRQIDRQAGTLQTYR